jgi:hypothetical protein
MGYNRKDLAVQVNIKTIKGYTMSDIGALEDRLRRLEYYSALNALELDAKTLSIRDASGNIERFKNGIFADPLNDHSMGRTNDSEYRIAISSINSLARPTFNELFFDFKLQPLSSSQYKIAGRYLMIDYDSEVLGGNPYATKYRNCTESFYKWQGTLRLYPSYDANRDITQGAPQNITVDLAGAFEAFLATGIAQKIDNVSVAPPVLTKSTVSGGTTFNYFSQTTTTTLSDIAVKSSAVETNLGDIVSDISVLPYMASKTICVIATGMRPNTTLYPYFDGVNVSAFCQQGKVNSAYATAGGDIDNDKLALLAAGKENTLIVPNGALGGTIKSDSKGAVYILFTIPAQTFRTGDRTFMLVNVDNIKSTDAIITSAEGVYSASNISFTRSSKTFNVKNPTFEPFTWNEYFTQSWTQVIPPRRRDPVGQTFSINGTNDINVPGLYLTEIGVFFKKKSDTLGATLKVCETVAGVPDISKVVCSGYLPSSSITVSDDSTAETRFKFEYPGLVQSDQTYFFYVEPDGSNPDYEIWISEVGGTDIVTNRAITQQPYPGIMYVSSDGMSWSPIQSSDIKFNLYRAKFKYNSATVTFRNDTDDYLTANVISRKTSGVAPQVGDVVYAQNTTTGAVLTTNNTIYPFGVIQYLDELTGTIYIDQSNGRFNNTHLANVNIYRVSDRSNTSLITETNRVANATIASVNNPIYHGIVPRFSIMEPINTFTSLSFKGTANSTNFFSKDGASTSLVNGTLYEFQDYERVIRSYSNEVAAGSYGNDGTGTFTVTLTTTNQYVSPVIDLGTKTFNIIQNRINLDANNEFTRYGNAQSKYISKTVFLTQEAEDLLVYVGAHRPPGSDIYVYGKFLNSSQDSAQFDDKDWSLLPYRNDTNLIYTSNDPSDFREYVFGPTVANTVTRSTLTLSANAAYSDLDAAANTGLISPNGTLTYFDGARRIYRGFNNFSLKVVLVSNNPVNIPTVRDIRAIALQI